MASGMSWLGWHRSNVGLRQGAMNLHNPKVSLSGQQPYHPGESVQGKASWGYKNNVKIKDTKLSVHGSCKVKWIVGFGENKMTFESEEEYANQTVFNDTNTEDNLLNANAHEVAFQFQLPQNVPSSFASKYGNVSYYVMLEAFYSDGRLTYKETYLAPFIVSNPYNHEDPESPLSLSGVESIGICGTKSTVEFEVLTNKRVFSPGEYIYINGFVSNSSKNRIRFIKMVLTQHITFTVSSDLTNHKEIRKRTNVVSTWSDEDITRGAKVIFDNRKTIQIPNIPESELQYCEAIHVEYTIKFGLKLSGMFSREYFSDSEEIFIGNSSRQYIPEESVESRKNVYVLMKNGSFMKL